MSLTESDIKSMIDKAIGSHAIQKAKADFAAANLNGVPAAYHSKLGDDPSKWPDESKAIRAQFETDFRALGVPAAKFPGVAASATAAADAGGAPGTDRLSPEPCNETRSVDQLKAMGLSDGEAIFARGITKPYFSPAIDAAGKPLNTP